MMYKKKVKDKDYTPNHFSVKNRLTRLCLILVLLIYGGYGMINGELYLSYQRAEITLQGPSIYLAFASFCIGAIYLGLAIVDHYDKRNNEHEYRRLEAIFKGLAILILLVALCTHISYTFGIQSGT
ncbi:hypothetical protein QTP81_16955 [Alteromonas sp. ASW11-36]|uniref:DUF4234 domain-containing protein n=1 Tax=Alteromonas arenosi TaxID=3055817 RepID=A0ABT7T1H2_9ALTE|nr:hypothetical protein [Alteromonas sp. ASW11-36]MDM7862299.1 hypothetical protein [Alteromonas sp. ASW11-36]